MLSIHSDTALITGNVLITVNTRTIRAEVRASDSGLNMKIYAVNLKHIYYLVRFCTVNSYHSVTGQLGVSAYCFDDSKRAYASIRVGLRKISPIFQQRAAGNATMAGIASVEAELGLESKPLKLEFVMYKYVFENWDDASKVSAKRIQKEAFGRQVQAMYEELISRARIISPISTSLVIFDETVVDRQVLETLRPSAEVLANNRVTTARYNDLIRRTDFSLPTMDLLALTTEEAPFHAFLFSNLPIPNPNGNGDEVMAENTNPNNNNQS